LLNPVNNGAAITLGNRFPFRRDYLSVTVAGKPEVRSAA
jgi:hypothetical protein